MIHRISHPDQEGCSGLVDQMYRLRARQFADRRGWRVDVTDGREIDRFDALYPLYIVVSDGQGQLLASLRLLPTTGPHMLSDVFPEVMGGKPIIRDPLVWESSRFCVDTEACREFRSDGINFATRKLLFGLFDAAEDAGMNNVVSVYDLYLERILRRAGCIFERVGPVVQYDKGLKTTAGLFEVSQRVLERLSDPSGVVA